MKNIFDKMQSLQNETIGESLDKFAKSRGLELTEENSADLLNDLLSAQDFVHAQMTGKSLSGESMNVPLLNMNEALQSNDVAVVMGRVIDTVLREPVEPNLFLQNSVAEVINLPESAPTHVEFTSVGALQAFDIGEGQEIQSQALPLANRTVALKFGKIAVGSALTKEVQQMSMWPLIPLHLKAMKAAIERKVESKLFQHLLDVSNVVFDNQSNVAAARTSGTARNQTPNGTFGILDLFKMIGVVMQKGFNATHFLAHPLAWSIFAQEPYLRAQFYHNGQLGNGIWGRAPQYDQQVNMPYSLQYVPYYALRADEGTTLTGAFSGLPAATVTDVYVLDKTNSLVYLKRGEVAMDQKENWYRESTMMKAVHYAATGMKEGGFGVAVAKNIRMDLNERAILTINQVTV